MAFSAAATAPRALAEINVTPLVDVMLVLLIIFMIAAPVMTRNIPLELPQPGPDVTPPPPKVEPVRLRIAADGQMQWNGAAVSATALQALLRLESARSPQATLEIESHGDSRYEVTAWVLALAKNVGMSRIGMVDIP